jgi:hypothetical protein
MAPPRTAGLECPQHAKEKNPNEESRRFVVDEAMGTIVGFVRFGPNRIPDTHLFRLEDGRIRYVRTLTVCPDTGCEFN